jgi:hypothetical protein
VLHLSCILFCDRCDAAAARTERGWRAYLEDCGGAVPLVVVLCPECAERRIGEDEAAWWE